MKELSIKIRIYDRQYPMKVHPNDEASVRKAAELINSQIKSYMDDFHITDIQDLLAMVAFDSLVDNMKTKNTTNKNKHIILEKLDSMIQIIDTTK